VNDLHDIYSLRSVIYIVYSSIQNLYLNIGDSKRQKQFTLNSSINLVGIILLLIILCSLLGHPGSKITSPVVPTFST